MTERARAIMQLHRAQTAIAAAKESFKQIQAAPSITGTAEHIEELIVDLFNYVIQEYKDDPEGLTAPDPVDDETDPENGIISGEMWQTFVEGTDSPVDDV